MTGFLPHFIFNGAGFYGKKDARDQRE